MVAPLHADIEQLRQRIEELRGAIWRDGHHTRERVDRIERSLRQLLAESDGQHRDHLEQLRLQLDCVRSGIRRPA